ncbi:MAG TPA: L-threonylcarbamoyladenylate synthase [Solirubrobacteraceae bacterium]
MALTPKDAETFERCMSVGGFAVFPTDTVYGLACDPDAKETLERIYLLKRRPPTKPSAVLFFDKQLAEAALPELPPATRAAFDALLPGAVTLLVSNPRRRYPLACGPDPETLGIRVPQMEGPMRTVKWPVLQTSANLSGEADPRRVEDVPERFRQAADLILDAGELPGTPSTVIDLRGFEDGTYAILREGAVSQQAVAERLAQCRP